MDDECCFVTQTVSFNASEDFEFEKGRYEWEVSEARCPLPRNYIDLQVRVPVSGIALMLLI